MENIKDYSDIIRFEQCEFGGITHNAFIAQYDKIKDFPFHRILDYACKFANKNFGDDEIKFNEPVIVRLEYHVSNEIKFCDTEISYIYDFDTRINLAQGLHSAINEGVRFIKNVQKSISKDVETKKDYYDIIRFEQQEIDGKTHNIFIVQYDKIKDFTTEHRYEILHNYSWDFVEENFDFGEIKFNKPVIVRLEYYESNEIKHCDIIIKLFKKIVHQLDLTHALQHAIVTFITDIKSDNSDDKIKNVKPFDLKEYDDHIELFMKYEIIKDLVENETTIYVRDIIDALLKDVDLSKNLKIIIEHSDFSAEMGVSACDRICDIDYDYSKKTIINEINNIINAYVIARKNEEKPISKDDKCDFDAVIRHKRKKLFNNIFTVDFSEQKKYVIGVDSFVNCEISVDYNKIIELSKTNIINSCKYFDYIFNDYKFIPLHSVITINYVNKHEHKLFEKSIIYDTNSTEKITLLIIETLEFIIKYYKDVINDKSLWTEKDIRLA